MKVLGYILLACIALSLLQAALSIVVIGFAIILLLGVYSHPRETFGFLGFVLLANLLQTHPIACVWLFSLLLIATTMIRLADNAPAKVAELALDPKHHQPRLPSIDPEGRQSQ